MENNEKVEEQVEDLDVHEQDAEDVKGGSLNFTREAGTPTDQLPAVQKSLNFTKGQDGIQTNHNQTLVRV